MKILHIGFNVTGGAGLGMLNLHRGLREIGVSSKILCFKKGNETDPNIFIVDSEFSNQGFCRRCIPALFHRLHLYHAMVYRAESMAMRLKTTYGVPASSPCSILRLEQHPLVQEADIVHLHWVSNMVDFPTFFPRIQKPVVWTVRDENPMLGFFHFRSDIPSSLPPRIAAFDRKIQQKKFDAVHSCGSLSFVSLCKSMKEFIEKSPLGSGRNVFVIPNSIDSEAFRPMDGSGIREEFHIPQGTKIILFAAQFLQERRKGLRDLIQAASSLNRDDLVILCVGKGFVPQDVPWNVRIVPVRFTTSTERLSQLYSASDVFAAPSYAETFGKTMAEALACGTPVVAYPNLGALDVVKSGRDGFLADRFSVDSLAEALDKGLRSSFDPAEMRNGVLERFSPSRIGSEYLRIYSNILGQG